MANDLGTRRRSSRFRRWLAWRPANEEAILLERWCRGLRSISASSPNTTTRAALSYPRSISNSPKVRVSGFPQNSPIRSACSRSGRRRTWRSSARVAGRSALRRALSPASISSNVTRPTLVRAGDDRRTCFAAGTRCRYTPVPAAVQREEEPRCQARIGHTHARQGPSRSA
jgi:hypothetical protein